MPQVLHASSPFIMVAQSTAATIAGRFSPPGEACSYQVRHAANEAA
jgi:hypothetical protein